MYIHPRLHRGWDLFFVPPRGEWIRFSGFVPSPTLLLYRQHLAALVTAFSFCVDLVFFIPLYLYK